MFEAIRSKLVGAWRDLHSRGLPSLFVFELVVVTLGVLIAQGMADWAGDRSAMRAMEVARERTDAEIAQTAGNAVAYQALVPCISNRMDEVLAWQPGNAPLEERVWKRPRLAGVWLEGLDNRQFDLLRRKHGDEVALRYRQAMAQADRMAERVILIAETWEGLALFDPSNAGFGELDRKGRVFDDEAR